MSKLATLMFITVLAVSSLVMVETAFAQSTPKPSVPEFTVSYHAGTIELSIKNQQIGYDSTYHIYFNVRHKSHSAYDWNEVYPIQTRQQSPSEVGVYIHVNLCTNQSDSDYTIISYPAYDNTIDFQVEAILGHDSLRFVPDHDLAPWIGGHYVPDVAYDESSGWSNTKTITVGESQTPTPSPETTPTPTPTITPYQEPQQTEPFEAILDVAIVVAVFGAGLGLLIYLIKRK